MPRAWRARLESHGLKVEGVVDHEGVWRSIYFGDPNGMLLEVTRQVRPLTPDDATKADAMLRTWTSAKAPA